MANLGDLVLDGMEGDIGLLDGFDQAIEQAADWAVGTGTDFANWGVGATNDIADWSVGAGGDIVDWSIGAGGDIVDWTEGAGNDFIDGLEDGFDWVTGGDNWEALGKTLGTGAMLAITGDFEAAGNLLGNEDLYTGEGYDEIER